MKTLFLALRATLFSTGFIFLWGWVALSLHRRYDTSLGCVFPGWTPALGIALMAAGGTLVVLAIVRSSDQSRLKAEACRDGLNSTNRGPALLLLKFGLISHYAT
jgi:hypothetical protein